MSALQLLPPCSKTTPYLSRRDIKSWDTKCLAFISTVGGDEEHINWIKKPKITPIKKIQQLSKTDFIYFHGLLVYVIIDKAITPSDTMTAGPILMTPFFLTVHCAQHVLARGN